MKILQVVTLISPDGAYGGPVRVAFNQIGQLTAQGHDATVAAAARGYDPIPDRIDGVAVRLSKPWRLIPFMGFAGLASPGMLWWMFRQRSSYDVVHVHLARDLVTLPAALLAIAMRKRLVVQTHGMIVESRRVIAPAMDWCLTRPVLRRADAVFFLSDAERRALLRVEQRLKLIRLPNGVPVCEAARWDDDEVDGVEVLYLARLQERKRPLAFVAAAAELLGDGVEATFRLVGPDAGEAAKVSAAIDALGDPLGRVSYEGPVPPARTVDRMRRAALYVLPSVDEPFPMSVLEAMAVGLPVVITDTCGLAAEVAASGSGIVVGRQTQSLADAVRTLIGDPVLRRRMGAAARRTVETRFSMAVVARRLSSVYLGEPVGNG